jgi:hypothetical protein
LSKESGGFFLKKNVTACILPGACRKFTRDFPGVIAEIFREWWKYFFNKNPAVEYVIHWTLYGRE